jgi:hypothetical protein
MGQIFLRIAISSVFLVALLMFRSSHHQEPTRQLKAQKPLSPRFRVAVVVVAVGTRPSSGTMSIGASGGAGGYGKFMIGSLAASYVVTVGKGGNPGQPVHHRIPQQQALLAEQPHWAQSQSPQVARGLRLGLLVVG